MARPTKYKKEYCKKMYNFFNIPHTFMDEITKFDKNGEEQIIRVEKPNILPTFEKFAVSVDVCVDTLNEWCKVHTEFSEAYKKCKHLQKDMLNDLAMRGFYNPTYTIFVAKNITDMKDKVEQQITETQTSVVSQVSEDKIEEVIKRVNGLVHE